MGWRTIYIEDSHKVSLYLNNLKIESGDETYVVPISDIDTVIFNNYKLYVTVQLLCKLTQNNICVIVCEKNGLPELTVSPITGNFSAFKQQELQLNLNNDDKKLLWQLIIRGKIINQAKVLDTFSLNMQTIELLLDYENEVDLDDITNREGLAAKVYFRALFGDLFIRDRGNCDPQNIALNYGYSIIRAMMCRSIIAKGLIPTIGIKHRNIYNHFNLADDFIEPFRPIVDFWVYKNIYKQTALFNREKRLSLLEALANKIYFNKKRYSIPQAINLFVDGIIHYMETNDERYIIMPEPEILYENE